MPQTTRRVVTGKDLNGKAIVIGDENLAAHERRDMGIAPTVVWVTDSMPARVRATTELPQVGVPPPAHGTVFRIVEIAPEQSISASVEERVQTMRRMNLSPEGPQERQPRHPGMHRTNTIDYAVVLAGQIDMLLDDSEVHLTAGDVVVQQGTNHAWTNRGETPCRIAFILVDAES